MSRAKLNTHEVMAALRERFPAQGGAWAFIEQVRNGTGYQRGTTRTADAIAMSLWPSRGLEIHGFEVKVSRSDWKRELEAPAKAEEIQRFCDRWWLVVGDEPIVQPGELPPTWGLIIPKGKGLVAKVEAPKLEAAPLDRLFVAAVFRASQKVQEQELDALIRQRVDERMKQQEAVFEASKRARQSTAERNLEELRKKVADFKASSNIDIEDAWDGADLGRAVTAVQEMTRRYGAGASISRLADSLTSVAEQVRELDTFLNSVKDGAR